MEKKESINSQIFLAIGVTALTTIFIAILWYSLDVFLVIFAGILLSILLNTFSKILSKKLHISYTSAFSLVVLLLFFFFLIFFFLLVPVVVDQFNQLTKELPTTWEKATQNLQYYLRWYPNFFRTKGTELVDLIPSSRDILTNATSFFSTTFGIIVSFVVFLFIGLFLAYDPQTYRNGLVRLIPIKKRKRAQEVLDEVTSTLRWWLVGKFFSMAIIGFFTTIGLWLLGVPLAITLGLIAAIFTFVPNLGAILATLPAVLIAAGQDLDKAFYVVILYVVIQTIESNVLTPTIQEKAISLPPALTISAQLLMAILVGGLGLVLATPLTAMLMVLIRMLYIEDVLKENYESTH